MRPSIRIALIALAITAWLLADCGRASGFEKGGGGGGGRGGGSGAARHAGGPKPSAQRNKPGGSHGHASAGSFRDWHHPKHVAEHKPRQHNDHIASGTQAPGESHPWTMQRANEKRKVEHRLGVADKLDRLAETNGNKHLKETAERMRQKAQDHYDKRLAKIDNKLPAHGVTDSLPDELSDGSQPLPEFPSDLSQSAGSSPAAADWAQKLTGRENALRRQLLNEERKLEHQTDLAERLRAVAEEQGDAALLESAERLEQQALDRFEKRMEAIRSFQERHGLVLGE